MARASIAIDAPLSAGIRRRSAGNNKNKKTLGTRRRTSSGSGGIRKIGRGVGGGTPRKTFRPTQSANRRVIPTNENREVRINLSNLAPSVLSGDLQQLFGEFKIRNVSVNFNENGKPVGTGDISLSKRNADRLIKKFAGVALDGKEMKFAIIDTKNIANRVKFPDAQPSTSSRIRRGAVLSKKGPVVGNKKKTVGGQKKTSTKKPKREAQPKKTVEELDAELDAYMAHSS